MATNFGLKLQAYLHRLGVKNAVLAKELRYDVSYISKWVNGSAIPSSKNAVAICRNIAKQLSQIKDAALLLDLEEQENITSCIAEELLAALEQDRKSIQSAQIVAIPVLSEDQLLGAADFEALLHCSESQTICAVDYFSLERETRLRLSGIQCGRFYLKEKQPDHVYRMAISLPQPGSQQDEVYDTISLIHMLTGLSRVNFALYKDPLTQHRFTLAAKGQSYASAMAMGRRGSWCAFCKNMSPVDANAVFQELEGRLCSDYLIFRKSDIPNMLQQYEYAQSVISTELRWLLGHLTEQLLPEDVFSACLAQQSIPEQQALEMQRVHQLTQGVLETGHVKIMVYDSSFANMIISGEIDFFNKPVQLTVSQRIKVLELLMSIAKKTHLVRIINGGFSSDFKYITNPCMFLSDGVSYLRLENGAYEDNILILNDPEIKKMFDEFYCSIWSARPDVVIDDIDRVTELMNHYLQRLRMLQGTRIL